jgi:hypothetical protein
MPPAIAPVWTGVVDDPSDVKAGVLVAPTSRVAVRPLSGARRVT